MLDPVRQADAIDGQIDGRSRRLVERQHGWVSLRPRQFDSLAIVHRAGARLSPAARLMIDLATRRIQAIAEPLPVRSVPAGESLA